MIADYQKVFKALGEPTRLRIIKVLSVQDMCVCELSAVLDMLQPRVSQHLRVLKEAGLVRESREAYWIYYSLDRQKLAGVWSDFQEFLNSPLTQLSEFQKEAEAIAGLEQNERVVETKNRLKRIKS